ncbi:hypothetical protein [Sphingobacterium sp. UBA6645]|uniref:hypothetical protein n=1 Tax=Sphingobacterium sp. UBA6645 TaxID=1947511 RepID=UPI0025CC4043|nr:hypothetical protein [Sphingobacterium sp. UBA6645]
MAFKSTKVYFRPNDDGAVSERIIQIGPFEYSSVAFEDGSKDRSLTFGKYLINAYADMFILYVKGVSKLSINI